MNRMYVRPNQHSVARICENGQSILIDFGNWKYITDECGVRLEKREVESLFLLQDAIEQPEITDDLEPALFRPGFI